MFVKTGLRFMTPRVALVSALASAAMLVAGCSDNPQGDGVNVEDGSLNGEIAVYMADNFEAQRSETQYMLRAPNGVERRLRFETDPGLEAGTPIKLWGTELSDGLAVQSFKTLPKAAPGLLERVVAPLKDGMKYAAKRLAFIIVDIGGGVGTWTVEKAQAELTGPSANSEPPTRDYYVEASYGTQDLDGRAFVLKHTMASCSNQDTSAMATALKPMVMSMGGGKFDHYLWFFGSRNTACSWAGLGEVGTPDRPTDDTWYNNSAGCVVMIQEPGHNFGMQHSSSLDCGTAAFTDNPNDGSCTHSEYGDRFDPMGGGCRHMNGWQKTYNGWLQGCNVVRVGQSGTFTLLPMELACDGTQLLQIPMPKTRMMRRTGGGGAETTESLTHYYLELRTPRGVDTGMTTSVQVRVSGPPKKRTERAVHTWILDMEPGTSAFDGMVAGKTFTDPGGGLTFTVTELDTSHATIAVEMTTPVGSGASVCLGEAPFTAPGPGIESCNAAPTTPGGGGASGSTGGAGGTSPGTGGRPGTGGGTSPGTGGRGGNGGSGGSTAPRTGGAPGSDGGVAIGSGGAPGSGGGLVIPGSGGALGSTGGATSTGGSGSGNDPGGGAGRGPGITPGDVTGGLDCSSAGGSPLTATGTSLFLGAMLLLGAARKRRRK
jgi:MYXO-CTERM domain-containing protein